MGRFAIEEKAVMTSIFKTKTKKTDMNIFKGLGYIKVKDRQGGFRDRW